MDVLWGRLNLQHNTYSIEQLLHFAGLSQLRYNGSFSAEIADFIRYVVIHASNYEAIFHHPSENCTSRPRIGPPTPGRSWPKGLTNTL